MIISGTNTITLNNILVGEVWLCSGQSNMEYPLDRKWKHYNAPQKGIDKVEQALKSATNPLIRILYVERKLQPELPTKGWVDCNDSILRFVSAVGYFFAKELAENLHVPIGIISTTWGGTRVEQWTPASAYQQSSLLKDSISGKKGL